MSSRRVKSDPTKLFVTPDEVTRAIIPYLPRVETVVDAGAGTGAIANVLADYLDFRWSRILACEVVESRAKALDHDLRRDHGQGVTCAHTRFEDLDLSSVGCVISNPSFALAEPFLRRACASDGSMTVALLVPVGWLRSHACMFADNDIGCGEPDVYLLDPRPSLTGGGTDSAEYCWAIFGPGRGGRWKTLHWRAVRGRK